MTPEMQTASYALADILPSDFARCFARSPQTAQQLWQLAVAIRQTEGARLADAVERITPERAQALRAIDRAQDPGADQERERAWVELEALFQIDGSKCATFEDRRRFASQSLRGCCADARGRAYDRYAMWGDMRVTSELVRMIGSARSGPFSVGARKRMHALGLDGIPSACAVWLECVERVRMTCEATGRTAPMAHFAHVLADVPFVLARSADYIVERDAFIDRVLAGQDPGVFEGVRQYLCEVSPEIRTAAWRVVEGALDLYRKVAAQAVFDDWVFPDDVDVKGCSGWESTIAPGGVEMSRIVYTSDSQSTRGDDASAKVSYQVVFDDALRIIDVSALDMRTGNEFGHTGAGARPCAPAV